MAVILVIFSGLSFLAGLGTFAASTSVLHEMLAGILFVVSAIFFSSAFIVASIDALKNKQIKLLTQIKDELRKERLGKYPDDIKKPD